MPEPQSPEAFRTACAVNPASFELRPDYQAPLLVVDGLDREAASSLAAVGSEVRVSRRLVVAP